MIGVVLVFRDVAERRRDTNGRSASRKRGRRPFCRSSLDAIITVDGEGKIVDFNPAAQALLSYSAAEAVGQDLDQFFVIDGKPGPFAHSLQSDESPPFNSRLEYPAVRKDGSRLTVELVVTRLEGSCAPSVPSSSAMSRCKKRRREAIGQLLESEKQRSELLKHVATASLTINSATSEESVLGVIKNEARDIIGAKQRRRLV